MVSGRTDGEGGKRPGVLKHRAIGTARRRFLLGWADLVEL